jgi:hypothetical protein
VTDGAGALPRIERLIGVYDADGTLRGELAYWVGRRLGRTHCALCDITHGAVRQRQGWRSCRASFGVAFETFHRDDQPEAVRAVTGCRLPAVVAQTAGGHVLLLGPLELERCGGSAGRLADAITAAALECSLAFS